MNKKTVFILIIIVFLAASALFVFREMRQKNKSVNQPEKISLNQSKNMIITSPAFENNGDIPKKYTCDGESISPSLEISGVPAEAKSLALILHDPDAPVAGGFTHWIIFNINPMTNVIAENSVPLDSIQGQNSSGRPSYADPCPPSGTHHYEFRLYALDTTLSLDSKAKKADVEKVMEGHVIDQTILIGLYSK